MKTHPWGIVFEQAWKRRETMTYRDVRFFVVSQDDLIASKKAAGHPRDLEDVRILEADQGQKGV